MGKIIDRAVLVALTATGAYLLFLNASGSIALACGLSFACCALLLNLLRRRDKKAGMTAAQAQTLLALWAYGDDGDAARAIADLLGRTAEEIMYLPKHPSATLSVGDVFSAWKSRQGEEMFILAAPCRADGRARAFAQSLHAPKVELADAAKLIPLIRRSDLTPPRSRRMKDAWARLKLTLASLPDRCPRRKRMLFGLGLMGLYLLNGNPAYLFLSVGSLFLAGVARQSATE